MNRDPIRLSREPLFDYIDKRWGTDKRTAADEMKIIWSDCYRTSRRSKTISLSEADRIATNLGLHPSEIWSEYWDIEVVDA